MLLVKSDLSVKSFTKYLMKMLNITGCKSSALPNVTGMNASNED